MTIHSDFWKERRTLHYAGVATLRRVRDSNRQRCYNAEFKALRPVQHTFADRQAAKGFARLLAKEAIATMRAAGIIRDDATEAKVRASFKVAFTDETLNRCDAMHSGAYFAKWGWTDVVIAHEMAHWADHWAHRLRGDGPNVVVDFEGHGPRWRGWFIHLLGRCGETKEGIALADIGKAAFATANLKFTLPTT